MTDYKIRYKVTGSDIGYAGENRRTKNVDKGETKVTAKKQSYILIKKFVTQFLESLPVFLLIEYHQVQQVM